MLKAVNPSLALTRRGLRSVLHVFEVTGMLGLFNVSKYGFSIGFRNIVTRLLHSFAFLESSRLIVCDSISSDMIGEVLKAPM